MEVEAQRQMVKRSMDNQKVSVMMTGQDSQVAKETREFPWNLRQESNANHTKEALKHYCQKPLREK
jgi:hypothetical protein